MDKDRRSLLTKGVGWVLGAAGVLLSGRFVLPIRVQDLTKRIRLGPVSALPAGTSRYLPDPDVHVIHESNGLYALSGRCTHLGCSVLRRPEGFSCPCHGARFDPRGQPIAGPAPRSLDWFKLTVENNNLVLHLDQTVKPKTMFKV